MSSAAQHGGVPLIRFDNVVKRFGGVTALRGVSLDLHAGEILALLGENGAGKSTLIKTLGGIVEPTEGSIEYRGQRYRHRPPRFGEHQPVAFIHQDLGLVEWMTIAENIALATGYPRRRGLIDWDAAESATRAALAQVDCPLPPTMRVRDLTRTEKSLVAIARALSVEADVLVLDEPSASLPADEVHRLFAALRPLKARGVGMIYVSHRLDEVFEIADRIAVLRDGALVGERRVADTTPEELVSLIVGKALDKYEATPRARSPETRLAVTEPHRRGRRAGRFLRRALRDRRPRRTARRRPGTGRTGAVRRPAARRRNPASTASSLRWPTRPRRCKSGIGLIARDRVEESSASGLTVRENMFINPSAVGRGFASPLSPRAEAEQARAIGARVGLRPNDPHLPIESFSGGNQQKVIVGRWLRIGGRVLIAEDPTAGVDVGAKAEIYRLLDQALSTRASASSSCRPTSRRWRGSATARWCSRAV